MKRYQESDKGKEAMKRYRESDKAKEAMKRYQESDKGKETIRKGIKKYIKKRRKEDPLFKLTMNVRNLIKNSLTKQGYSKETKTAKIVGIDFDGFRKHIENQFDNNMTWENYGEWELDHIIPISSAESKTEIYELNHFLNFQPMWESENIQKSDNYRNKDKIKMLEKIKLYRLKNQS